MKSAIAEKKGTKISLVFDDLTTKIATVSKLTQIISWKGNYFCQMSAVSLTYYKQVSGEDLSNIEM